MTVVEHLEELRQRIIKAGVAILLAAAVCYFFSDALVRILKMPAGPDIQLYFLSPMDGFMIKWKIALFGGLGLSFPIWAYQVFAFVSPGLTPEEKRFLVPLIGAMFVLFMIGAGFGYYLLPTMLEVVIGMGGPELKYLPNASQYFSFVLFFLLACALAFELPVAVLALVRIGVLSPDTLRRQRRMAYFLMFVFAELVTPVADPIVAPLTILVPMLVLSEATIFVARLMVRRKKANVPAVLPG